MSNQLYKTNYPNLKNRIQASEDMLSTTTNETEEVSLEDIIDKEVLAHFVKYYADHADKEAIEYIICNSVVTKLQGLIAFEYKKASEGKEMGNTTNNNVNCNHMSDESCNNCTTVTLEEIKRKDKINNESIQWECSPFDRDYS